MQRHSAGNVRLQAGTNEGLPVASSGLAARCEHRWSGGLVAEDLCSPSASGQLASALHHPYNTLKPLAASGELNLRLLKNPCMRSSFIHACMGVPSAPAGCKALIAAILHGTWAGSLNASCSCSCLQLSVGFAQGRGLSAHNSSAHLLFLAPSPAACCQVAQQSSLNHGLPCPCFRGGQNQKQPENLN